MKYVSARAFPANAPRAARRRAFPAEPRAARLRAVIARTALACALLLVLPSAEAQSEPPTDAPVVRAGLGQGFELARADGRQSLRIAGLLSARAGVEALDDEAARVFGFVRFGRLALTGNLAGRELTYFFQGELAGTPQLLDLELTWSPVAPLRLRFGRVRAPLGRQWITPFGAMMLPDRSITSDLFRPGRDTGVTVEAYPLDGRFEFRAGAYAEGGDRWPRSVARAAVSPLGAMPYSEDVNATPGPVRFQIGANGAFDRFVKAAGAVADRATGGVDLAFRGGPVAIFAEGYVERRHLDAVPGMMLPGRTALAAGAFGQAGVFLLPGRLEAFARFDVYAEDVRNAGADGVRRYEVGVGAYFFQGALKLQARYSFDDVDEAANRPTRPLGAPARPEGHAVDAQFLLAL